MLETANYFSCLSMELDPDLDDKATHLFFRKAPTIIHNRTVIDNLPRESMRLKAEDKCYHAIPLKQSCKMLVTSPDFPTLACLLIRRLWPTDTNCSASSCFDIFT